MITTCNEHNIKIGSQQASELTFGSPSSDKFSHFIPSLLPLISHPFSTFTRSGARMKICGKTLSSVRRFMRVRPGWLQHSSKFLRRFFFSSRQIRSYLTFRGKVNLFHFAICHCVMMKAGKRWATRVRAKNTSDHKEEWKCCEWNESRKALRG